MRTLQFVVRHPGPTVLTCAVIGSIVHYVALTGVMWLQGRRDYA